MSKKVTNNKNKKTNKNMRRKQNGGFTLIELLATITILAIVSVIVVYTATNVISKAKEKSYKVSISNIEQDSGAYAIENQSTLRWLPDSSDLDSEYFCVTVKDLIGLGYFDNDVLKSKISDNREVQQNDYIYLKRNKTSKTITENRLLTNPDETEELCGEITSLGIINFTPDPRGWSRTKDVTIDYQIFNFSGNGNEYTYAYLRDDTNYNFEENFINADATTFVDEFAGNSIVARIYQTKNGTKDLLEEKTYSPKIDAEGPTIELLVNDGETFKQNNNVTIKLVDSKSGFRRGNYKVYYKWSTEEPTCAQIIQDNRSVEVNVSDDNLKESNSKTVSIGSPYSGAGKVYACTDTSVTDYVGNQSTHIASETMKLDNDSPVITINDYEKTTTARGSTRIELHVNDPTTEINQNTFDESDIIIIVGTTQLNTSALDLRAVGGDAHNTVYDLVITNTTLDGRVSIKINDGSFNDRAGNPGIGLEETLDITFKNTYTVLLNLGNGTSTSGTTQIGSKTCIYETNCALPSFNTLEHRDIPADWNFAGWSNTQTGTTRNYSNAGNINYDGTDETIRLYAVLQKEFRFYMGINPTSVSTRATQYWNPYSTSTSYMTGITLPNATTINTWNFYGYLIGSNIASSSYTYNASSVGTNVTPEYNVDSNVRTVYKRTLTISYNGNGAPSGSTATQSETQYYNSGIASNGSNNGANVTRLSFNLSNNGFSYPKHNFKGWNTSANGSGTQYDEGSSYTFAPNVSDTTTTKTMYATWEVRYATCPTTLNGYSGTYDGTSHTITATGHSGGTLQYRTSPTGSWSATKPTITNAGTTTVYVQVAGDSNHSTKDCGSRNITISQKPITITAKNQMIPYGTAITQGTGQVTVAGLLSGHSLTAITLNQNTTNVGTGTITPSAAVIKDGAGNTISNNYSITYTNGTLNIMSAEIKNITACGYDVYVYGVPDASRINRVQFPTWTNYNGQDDIQSNWQTNSSATGTNQGNGTYYFRVNVSDHNRETGVYNTHVYIYDNAGNYIGIGIAPVTVPAITVTIGRNNPSYGTVSASSVNVACGTTYSANGATLTFSNGATVTASPTTTTTDIRTFSSWSSTSGTITGATTITANFASNPIYTISYDACGGSPTPSSQTKIHGQTLTLRTDVPSKTGYTFEGWSNANSCDEATSPIYEPGGAYTSNETKKLYAVWKSTKHMVKFIYEANGGTGEMADTVFEYGSLKTDGSGKNAEIPISVNTFIKAGHGMIGWKLSRVYNGQTQYYGCTDGKACSGGNSTIGWYPDDTITFYLPVSDPAEEKPWTLSSTISEVDVTFTAQWKEEQVDSLCTSGTGFGEYSNHGTYFINICYDRTYVPGLISSTIKITHLKMSFGANTDADNKEFNSLIDGMITVNDMPGHLCNVWASGPNCNYQHYTGETKNQYREVAKSRDGGDPVTVNSLKITFRLEKTGLLSERCTIKKDENGNQVSDKNGLVDGICNPEKINTLIGEINAHNSHDAYTIYRLESDNYTTSYGRQPGWTIEFDKNGNIKSSTKINFE